MTANVSEDGETNLTDVTTIRPPARAELIALAGEEYRRLSALLEQLSGDDWDKPTDCAEWSVRDLGAHLLGAMESNGSMRESLHQLNRGRRWASQHRRPLVDGINAVQISERKALTTGQLVARVQSAWPRALRARFRFNPLGPLPVPAGVPGVKNMSMGTLLQVIYTRDVWIHRLDIHRAVGRDMGSDRDHDRKLLTDIVREWATRHGRPFRLLLDGPAGGAFSALRDGEELHLDALEFARIVSGRATGTGLLAQRVVF